MRRKAPISAAVTVSALATTAVEVSFAPDDIKQRVKGEIAAYLASTADG